MIAIQNADAQAPQVNAGGMSDIPARCKEPVASALDLLVDTTPSYSQERKELMALRSALAAAQQLKGKS